MIDIHNHILPGVDDGTQCWEESLTLLQEAEKDGIKEIIITPHYMKNGPFKKEKNLLKEEFERFKAAVNGEGIDIELYLGNELYIHKDLPDLLEGGRINSLDDSMYLLVEFPFDQYKKEYDEILYDLRCMGYCIIIAHPERYYYVQKDLNFCLRWLNEGDLLQCNATSLYSHEAIVDLMIHHHFVSFIASDAHNGQRPLRLGYAYEKILNKFGEETAEILFNENQRSVLQNCRIKNTVFEMIKEKKGLLTRLFK